MLPEEVDLKAHTQYYSANPSINSGIKVQKITKVGNEWQSFVKEDYIEVAHKQRYDYAIKPVVSKTNFALQNAKKKQ